MCLNTHQSAPHSTQLQSTRKCEDVAFASAQNARLHADSRKMTEEQMGQLNHNSTQLCETYTSVFLCAFFSELLVGPTFAFSVNSCTLCDSHTTLCVRSTIFIREKVRACKLCECFCILTLSVADAQPPQEQPRPGIMSMFSSMLRFYLMYQGVLWLFGSSSRGVPSNATSTLDIKGIGSYLNEWENNAAFVRTRHCTAHSALHTARTHYSYVTVASVTSACRIAEGLSVN